MKHCGTQTIETERLFLREMNEDYYVALYRLAGGCAHAAGYR